MMGNGTGDRREEKWNERRGLDGKLYGKRRKIGMMILDRTENRRRDKGDGRWEISGNLCKRKEWILKDEKK